MEAASAAAMEVTAAAARAVGKGAAQAAAVSAAARAVVRVVVAWVVRKAAVALTGETVARECVGVASTCGTSHGREYTEWSAHRYKDVHQRLVQCR